MAKFQHKILRLSHTHIPREREHFEDIPMTGGGGSISHLRIPPTKLKLHLPPVKPTKWICKQISHFLFWHDVEYSRFLKPTANHKYFLLQFRKKNTKQQKTPTQRFEKMLIIFHCSVIRRIRVSLLSVSCGREIERMCHLDIFVAFLYWYLCSCVLLPSQIKWNIE